MQKVPRNKSENERIQLWDENQRIPSEPNTGSVKGYERWGYAYQ